MIDEPTTRHLEEVLKKIDTEPELERYLKNDANISPYASFAEYFSSLPKVAAIPQSELYASADIERSYCYHILNGQKVPGRDKILRLCIAAGLDETETRRALEAGKEAPLYSRSRRDAVITFAIKNGCSVMETNELLDRMGLEALS